MPADGAFPTPRGDLAATVVDMALVRCTCLVTWTHDGSGRPAIDVRVLDPECGYVLHRAMEGVVVDPIG